MKVTITKALSELKKIDNRIKDINFNNIGQVYKNKDKDLIKEQEKNDKSLLDSYNSLFKRKVSIKTAIAKANIETLIEFENSKISLYTAICIKEKEQNRLKKLKDMYKRLTTLESIKEDNNNKLDKSINSIAEAAYNGTKPSSSFLEELTKSQYSVAGSQVVFPYDIKSLLEEIQKSEDFICETDILLSEINAKTMIEIPES